MVGGSRDFSFSRFGSEVYDFNKSVLLYSPAGLQLKRSTSASALLSAGIKGMTTTSCRVVVGFVLLRNNLGYVG